MDLAAKYRQLDAKASDAETRATSYRERAAVARWEQCRIAHEAIEGGMSRRAFANAVGHGDSHIGKQVRMWELWGASAPAHLPDYSDCYSEVNGNTTGSQRTKVMAERALRNLSDEDAEDIVAVIAAKRPAVVARAQSRASAPRPSAPFTSPPVVGDSDRIAVLSEDAATVARLNTAVHVFQLRVVDAQNDPDRAASMLESGEREAGRLAMALDVLRGLGDPADFDWEAAR